MSKLTCGECGKQFEADDTNDHGNLADPADHYWICPHCDTVLQEPES